MISPLILVSAVYTIVDSMSGLSNVIITKIYSTTFSDGSYGYGAAMGWVYFLLIFLVLIVFLFIASRKVYYEND